MNWEYLIEREQIAHVFRAMAKNYSVWSLSRNDLKRYCQSQWLYAVLDNDKKILAYWNRKKQRVFAVHSSARYIRYFVGRADNNLVEIYNREVEGFYKEKYL